MLWRASENLLDNAVRHARAVVLVRWGCEDGEHWFAIADDGRGVDPSDLLHLIEPLNRGEASRNRRGVEWNPSAACRPQP